jgi:hypothetical protein
MVLTAGNVRCIGSQQERAITPARVLLLRNDEYIARAPPYNNDTRISLVTITNKNAYFYIIKEIKHYSLIIL